MAPDLTPVEPGALRRTSYTFSFPSLVRSFIRVFALYNMSGAANHRRRSAFRLLRPKSSHSQRVTRKVMVSKPVCQAVSGKRRGFQSQLAAG